MLRKVKKKSEIREEDGRAATSNKTVGVSINREVKLANRMVERCVGVSHMKKGSAQFSQK